MSLLALHPAIGRAQEDDVAVPVESAYERKVRDDVDATGPHDERATRRLQQVEEYITDERWDRAMEMLSYTLDQDAGSLVRLADGQLVPVVGEVHRLLSELPADSLDLWRRQYEEVAAARLEEGLASGRRELVEQVATEFRLTDAGRRAVIRLARVHADRGEFALAARYLRDLDPQEIPVEARLRGVRTWIMSQNEMQVRRWLDTVPREQWGRLAPEGAGLGASELISLIQQRQEPMAARDGWRHPFGGTPGFGLSAGGAPLLLKRWTRPLTQDVNQRAEIARLNETVQEQIHAIMPAAIPLVAGDQVLARMWGRICAYDLSNGRLIWESMAESTGEVFDESDPAASNPFNPARAILMRNRMAMQGMPHNAHPLADPLYRDGVHGLLTADKERVYFVQKINENPLAGNRPVAAMWNNNGQQIVGPGTNVLHAFDLKTGQPAWHQFGGVGGDLDLGAFERPLAGYYFLGPPLPLDDELYVIGEREGEIELIAIDPASGMKRWSRHIATASRPISQEPVRQNWNAQVAESDGILICPTTVGWLVAVDKVNRSLLWAYRYAPVAPSANPERRDGDFVTPAALDQRWGPAAPMIVDGRVIFTPPEEVRLVCLDLVTGEELWRRGKGTYRYVAGVAGDRLIVVGPRSVDAIDPATATGVVRWSFRIPNELGYPTGRGVLSKDQFLLPTTHAVLTIATADGSRIDTTKLNEGQPPLGNLVMHEGALVSLAVDGLSVYEERGHYLEAIERVQADDAHPNRSRYMRARLSFAEGRLEEAAATLDEMDVETSARNPTAEQVARLRWDVLTRLIQEDPGRHATQLEQLQELADTPAEHLIVQRLTTESLAAAGRVAEAADRYLQLLAEPADTLFAAEGPGHRQVRLDYWISGKLLDLWNGAEAEQQEQIAAVVRRHLAEQMTDEKRGRVVQAVSMLPGAREYVLEQARQARESNKPAEAEIWLLRLLDSPAGPLRQEILEELARVAEEHHLQADADYWRWQQKTGEESPEKTAKAKEKRKAPSYPATMATGHDWSALHVELAGNGRIHTTDPPKELEVVDSRLPFHEQFRVQVMFGAERLLGPDVGRLDEPGPVRQAPVPLRSRQSQPREASAHAVGHVLVTWFNGLVQAVSLIDGRVLWSWTPDEPVDQVYSYRTEPGTEPMKTGRTFVATDEIARRARGQGGILAAGAGYVLVQDSQRVTVLDTLTGRARWSRDRFSPEAAFVGTANYIYVMNSPHGGQGVQAIRAVDGNEADVPDADRHIAKSVGTVGDCLLTLNDSQLVEFLRGGATLSLRDPLNEETLWSREFDSDALFSRGTDGTFFVLSPDNGKLVAIDPATGHQWEIGTIPSEVLNQRNEVYLLTDLDSVYVMVNQGSGNRAFFSPQMPAINVDGELFVFNRHGGGLRWKEEIDSHRLLVESFAHLPVLVFVTANQKNIDQQTVWQAKVLVIDKTSGETAADKEIHMRSRPTPRRLEFDAPGGTIDLSFSSSRIHLSAGAMEDERQPVEAEHP